jgi:uncharacterized membrane protein
MEAFQGPIPPPAVLEAYEALVPGGANRILKMAENQAAHRQEIEKIVVRSGSRDSLWGIVVSAIIALCAFGWSGYALSIGQTAEAVNGIVVTILGFVSAFVYGKRSTRLERQDRARLNRPTN